MKLKSWIRLLRSEHGGNLVELALVLPLFLLLILGAVDFGRFFYLSIEIASAAHAGAMYGAQNPTDTTGIQSAALNEAPDASTLSAGSPAYGCECSDGSDYSASCGVKPPCLGKNVVYRVDVTVTGTYKSLVPWPGIPSPLTLSTSASMRSAGS